MRSDSIKRYLKKHNPSWDYKKSFSQTGEDVLVKYIFDQIGILRPSYIDIGAFDPFEISNTALFYDIGCRGVNIEPNPLRFKKFLKYRKEDVNLNLGVGMNHGSLDYYRISSPSLNTFSEEVAKEYEKKWGLRIEETIKVEVKTLPQIVDEYCAGAIPQFLSIDVEGSEFDIIQFLPELKQSPVVICIETVNYTNDNSGVKQNKIINYLTDLNYFVYADNYLNTILVDKETWKSVKK